MPLGCVWPAGGQRYRGGGNIIARPDRKIRTDDNEINPDHMRIIAHEYGEGLVYDQGGLRIIAIEVDHGEFIKPAYAFRVEYADHVFVHSHDTRYNENLIAQAQGADVFVHEVAARARGNNDPVSRNPGGAGPSRNP